MTLPELSIRRHVMAVMMSAVLALFGVIAYQQVGNDRVPNVDFPIVSISTSLPGADPDTVARSVTHFIERAVNTVPGIDNISSVSSPGRSTVNVIFNLDKDIDVAFSEVQTRVSAQVGNLPTDADAPVINKVEADAQPVMWLVVRGDRTLQQLSEIARNTVRPQLEQIAGVGEVRLGGSRNRRIRIELDTDRMNHEAVTVSDVLQAIGREHVRAPGGFMVGGRQERMLRLDLEYHDIGALGDLIVSTRGNRLVRLRDVADVIDGLTDFRSLARFGGDPAVGLGVVKIPGANTVAVVDAVHESLDRHVRPRLPAGVTVTVASDQSVFIRSMIGNLETTLFLAVLLAGLVMWIFLKSLRSTLIVTASIPVSLLAVVAVIHFFGYTLNSMTMLAILLLIGIVVDDSIVVLENIWRHRESGETDRTRAALTGSNEVYFAVVASSLSLTAIFGSVVFMQGMVGRFFESFAVVVVFGVVASTFVALTLVPMLCARHLYIPPRHGRIYWTLENGFRRVDDAYRRLLAHVLDVPARMLAVVAVLLVPALLVVGQVGAEFAPDEDEGQFVVSMRAPLGASVHYMDEKVAEVERILSRHPEVANHFTAIGVGSSEVNAAVAFVRLRPWAQRSVPQRQVINELDAEFRELPGVRVFASSAGMVGGGRGEPLQFHLLGPDTDELAVAANALAAHLEGIPGLGRVDVDLRMDQPDLRLVVDRERANLLGLTTSDVVNTVNVLVGGTDVARFDDDFGGGERFRVRVKGREDQFQTPGDIARIWMQGPDGERIRLDTVARFEESTAPAVIARHNLQYAASFYASPEMPLADAVEAVRAAATALPPGFTVALAGQAEELGRTTRAIVFVFSIAILLVYMVLASQFNSYVQPALIMIAMPLAMVGAFVGLWITGMSLNIYSMIGLVLLIGVVTKNAILLIDLTNQYRARGLDVTEALIEACPVRLRPVLMTSLTLILAMVPAALDTGPGSQGNAALAVTIIFGMVFSTALTLLLVPAAYQLVEGRQRAEREPVPQEAG